MGSVALITKDDDTFYNGIKVYEGSGSVGACGWGVRERDAATEANSVLCMLYPPPLGSNIKYVSFRVDQHTGLPGDGEVRVSFWKLATGSLSYTKITDFTIEEADLVEQYGAGTTWANDTIYTIELEEPINIIAAQGFTYYMAVYSFDVTLDYDTDGSTNGAYWVNADMANNDTYSQIAMTLSNWAVSCECFTEPNSWNLLEDGGGIADNTTDWENGTYCTGDWDLPNLPNIYDGDLLTGASSTVAGEKIDIDVSGDNLLPTGDAWSPASNYAQAVFPDYTAYGVRAISHIEMTLDVPPGEKVYVQINDSDDPTLPTVGWQTVKLFDGTGPVTETFYVTSIARWVRIVRGAGAMGACIIYEVDIYTISYGVDDGDFPVDVVNDDHHVWVENYPTAVAIRKATVKNMAGAESSPGLPFTNRENID